MEIEIDEDNTWVREDSRVLIYLPFPSYKSTEYGVHPS